MQKLPGVRSNWEVVVFFLIQPLITEARNRFSRSKILSGGYDEIYKILVILGHKKKPTSMEQTIQKTLQTMRDKGWVSFLGSYSGEYELTDKGYEELERLKDILQRLNSLKKELEAVRRSIE